MPEIVQRPLKLNIVICSTRPGRIGPSVAGWFHDHCRRHRQFESELVDLADFGLPLFDEAKHPRLGQYEKAHTIAWSKSVDEADAFVFVTPEYNYGPPPYLLNALNFLYREWNYKPAGFVSYGGISGGGRGTYILSPILNTLKVVPIKEAVFVPFVNGFLDEERRFTPETIHETAADIMVEELHRWAVALRPMRTGAGRA